MRGSLLALMALMLILAGCGQKGPLYREGDRDAPGNARAPVVQTISSHLC